MSYDRKKRQATIEVSGGKLKKSPVAEEALTKRRCVIFYADHCPENFLNMISKVGFDIQRLKKWVRRYSDAGIEYTMSKERYRKTLAEAKGEDDKDFLDYAKEDMDDSKSALEEVINCMFYDHGGGLSFNDVSSVNGRYDNEFGITLSKYGTFFVKVKDFLESGGELILAFANSKRWELPVSLDLVTGEWKKPCRSIFCGNPDAPNEYPETWNPLKGCEESLKTARDAYEALHCLDGNFGVAYSLMGDSENPDSLQEENSFEGHKYLEFDCYEGFAKVLGQDTPKTRELWYAWRPEEHPDHPERKKLEAKLEFRKRAQERAEKEAKEMYPDPVKPSFNED